MYTIPEMPLEAWVWFSHPGGTPVPPADETAMVSLSPCRPEDYYRGVQQPTILQATHIIRALADPRYTDMFDPQVAVAIFPCTCFEIPPGSKHYYIAMWAHQVGAGFPNHHARIYVARGETMLLGEQRPFIGYI